MNIIFKNNHYDENDYNNYLKKHVNNSYNNRGERYCIWILWQKDY